MIRSTSHSLSLSSVTLTGPGRCEGCPSSWSQYSLTRETFTTGWICIDFGNFNSTALGPAKPMIVYGPSHRLDSLQEAHVKRKFSVESQTCWLMVYSGTAEQLLSALTFIQSCACFIFSLTLSIMSSISNANFWAAGALSKLMGSIPIHGRYDRVTSKGDFLVKACFLVLMKNWAIGSWNNPKSRSTVL